MPSPASRGLLKTRGIEAAPQPGGEMLLAQMRGRSRRSPGAARGRAGADHLRTLTPQDLRDRGHADAYAGALWEPVGFGLHPLDYVRGRRRRPAARREHRPAFARHALVAREGGFHCLVTPRGRPLRQGDRRGGRLSARTPARRSPAAFCRCSRISRDAKSLTPPKSPDWGGAALALRRTALNSFTISCLPPPTTSSSAPAAAFGVTATRGFFPGPG